MDVFRTLPEAHAFTSYPPKAKPHLGGVSPAFGADSSDPKTTPPARELRGLKVCDPEKDRDICCDRAGRAQCAVRTKHRVEQVGVGESSPVAKLEKDSGVGEKASQT